MFDLDPLLAADSIELGYWPLAQVRLMNRRAWPWLILVPRRNGLVEVMDLPAPDQLRLMAEIVRAARILTSLYKPDKINIGALGNQVRQLHVHVVARSIDDPAWPGPVWGANFPDPGLKGT